MTKTELKHALERYRQKSKFIKKLTASALVKETSSEQEKRIAFLLRPENYNAFFDYYFGVGVSNSLADAPCADFHLSSYKKVFADPFIVQQRRWYRGAAKSIHSNVGNICHLKQNNMLYFGLIVGRNEKMSKTLLSDLQVHLQFNERYIKDFGIQFSYGNWADGEFYTTDNKLFMALGLNQPFRGLRHGQYRIDFASVDDVEDRKQAKNTILTQESVEKLTGDLFQAYHLERGRTIISNNYIVKDGILDGIAHKMKQSKRLHIQTINLTDKDGKPSWHQRISKEKAQSIIDNTDHYTLQRELYNNPIEEGKLFKAEWVRYIKVHGNKRDFTGLIMHLDLSYKKNGDYKAGVLLGFGDGRITVLEEFCRKCDLTDAVKWYFDIMQQYEAKGLSISAYYDATAAQESVYMPIFQSEAKRLGYFSLPLPAHVGTDKHLRIEATLTDVLFNGLLVWDDKLKETPDHESGMAQLLSFEKNTSNHDDYPDTLEGAVRIGRQSFTLSSNEPMMGKALIKHRTRKYGY